MFYRRRILKLKEIKNANEYKRILLTGEIVNIIIIGCGKVGLTLAEKLGNEEHNLVLIDTSMERIQSLPEDVDAIF